MKIYHNGEIIDASKESIVIIFDDDTELLESLELLSSLPPRKGPRLFSIFPQSQKDIFEEIFAKLCPDTDLDVIQKKMTGRSNVVIQNYKMDLNTDKNE